jgi:hypothetical protein
MMRQMVCSSFWYFTGCSQWLKYHIIRSIKYHDVCVSPIRVYYLIQGTWIFVRRCDLRFAVISWDDPAFGLVPVRSLLDPVMQIGSEIVAGGSFVIFLSPPTV